MALAAVAVLAAVGIARATPASAATLNAVATVTNASTNTFLPSGASAARFTVALPANAACSGDTANRTATTCTATWRRRRRTSRR